MPKNYSHILKQVKKRFFFLVLLLLATIPSICQITIGAGTSTQRYPFNYWYGYSRTATIYSAAEMNTATAGSTITTISWYSTVASTITGPTVIYLKQVGSTTAVASATWANTITGAATVYTGTPASWTVGWNSIDITDYPIAAGQNLEVLVECNTGGGGIGTSTSTAFQYTAGPTASDAYWQADNAAPTSTPSTTNTSRPNVILGGLTPPACVAPTGITVGSITTTSASVSIASTGSFIVEYGVAGFTPGTGATAGTGGAIATGTTSPIALSGLIAGTTYDVYVRQNCTSAGNGYSANANKVTFSTNCAPVSSFLENFDGLTVPALPICFKKVGLGGSASTQSSSASSNPNTLYIFSGSTTSQAVVALPPVSNAGAGTNQLRFKLRANFTAGDTLQAGYLANISDSSTFVVLAQYRATSTTVYTEYTFNPGTTPGANQYLAFRAKGVIGASMLVDDIFWEALPTCITPTSVGVASVTTTSASVSFTSTGNNFIVEYGAAGFTPGTVATAGTGGTVVTGTTSPIAITGLSSSSAFDVYVRQNCTGSGNGYSTNSVVASFSTLCTPSALPYSENFDAVTAPALPPCIVVENVNGSNTWAPYATTFTGSTTSNVMRYLYNSNTAADDWFFLRGVNLTAGTSYDIKFKYAGTGFPEKLEVRAGTAATSVSALAGPQLFNNTSITAVGDGSGTFVPTTTGVYYFGFHVYSLADQNALYVDNISIDITPACPIPTSITVSTITSTSASVSFTSTGNNFILEYGATGFTPGTGATAGAGGTVITGASSPISITGLTASTTYQVYVRRNCTAAGNGYSANSSVTSFTTTAAAPANDNATGAITLTVGAGCTGAAYTNVGATLSTGEPYPSCSGAAANPVWFKFVAPASGAVRISTDLGTGATLTDTKAALFSATDPANYATFSIISCDDDGGSTTDFASVLFATGLTTGTTYYVSLDKYSTSTSNGTFCIAVDEIGSSMLATTNTCTSTYQLPAGSTATYSGWVPIMDGSSKLIALVRNPAGGSPSNYTSVGQNVNAGTIRQSNSTYYLDRNYRITNTTATNVDVQLFFLNTELASLTAADRSVTLSNLGVTRQAEATAGCYNDFSPANGAITFISQTGNGTVGGVNWISFTTPGFSNFYLNRAGTALPLTLEYLKGLKAGTGNALNWKVNCTSVSITMELERSSDSRTFKSITSITASQVRCGQPFDYTDAAPLKGINYYRLKMIDVDGKVTYSPIVAIISGSTGAELVGIYPTVVRDEAFLSIAASRTAKMQINISDMSGKVIRTISQTVANGSSLLSINTANLATGVYNITGMLDGVQTKTLRFVKQ